MEQRETDHVERHSVQQPEPAHLRTFAPTIAVLPQFASGAFVQDRRSCVATTPSAAGPGRIE